MKTEVQLFDYRQWYIDNTKDGLKKCVKEIKDLNTDLSNLESLKGVFDIDIIENIRTGKYFKIEVVRGVMFKPDHSGGGKKLMDICFISFNKDYFISCEQKQFIYRLLQDVFNLECIQPMREKRRLPKVKK